MIKCKKIISMVMLLGMMATIFSVNVYAGSGVSTLQTTDYGIEEGSFGENIRYSFNAGTGELTISGEGAWECRNNEFYRFSKKIKSVKIEEGVTSIPHSAFLCCKNLTSVTIPNSVKRIGNFAFSDCKSLISVTIPGSVKWMGQGIFNGCHLSSITYLGNIPPVYVQSSSEIPGSLHYIPSILKYIPIMVPDDYQGNEFCGYKVVKDGSIITNSEYEIDRNIDDVFGPEGIYGE